MTGATWQGPYWRLWSASSASNVGDGIRAAAFPLIAASFSQDPLVVGGLTVAAYLPWLLFGLLGGAIVDRVDRRRLSWTVNALRALALAALMGGLAADVATVKWLYAAAFMVGVGETLADNAMLTMVPTLVPAKHLERANGRIVAAQVAGNEFVGPLLGGVLFSWAMLLPVAADGVVLGVAAILLLSLPGATGHGQGTDARTSVRDSIVEGLHFVRGQPRLRAVMMIGTGMSLADAAWFSLLVLYAEQRLVLPASAFGLLLAAGAVGGIVGGALAGRMIARSGRGAAVVGVLVATAGAQLVIAIVSNVATTAVMLAISSAAFAIWNTVSVTERHVVTPHRLLGRVNAAYRTAAIGAAPIGAIIGGLVARHFGLTAPLLAGVVPLFALAAVARATLAGVATPDERTD